MRQGKPLGPQAADFGIDEAEQPDAARLLASAPENLFAQTNAEHGLRRLADEVRETARLDRGHRRAGRAHAGKKDAVGGADVRRLAADDGFDAQALHRKGERRQVGDARIKNHCTHQSTPLEDGRSLPSILTASRSVLPNALKRPSAT